MVLVKACNKRELKKRIKRWKKLGFDFYEIEKTFASINEMEINIKSIENNLKVAIGIADENSKKFKEKKEHMDKLYEYLTTQERIK
jgi:ferritin